MEAFFEWASTIPEPLQWFGVFLLGAIPYLESYGASAIGVVTGMNVIAAITVAVFGNALSMLGFVFFGQKIRHWRKTDEKPVSERTKKLKIRFDRYGIIGVSLLGQTLLPSQITSMLMVTFGAQRNKVILWQIISIILWGTLFGTLAHFGISLLN